MINEMLSGAPSFGTVAKHPFDIIVTSEVTRSEDLIGKFRIAYWIKGHNKEREFLEYHFQKAQDRGDFIYFLENFLHQFNPNTLFQKDFDSEQEISDFNRHKALKSADLKEQYIRAFIEQKLQSPESKSLSLQKIKDGESVHMNNQLVKIFLATNDIFQSNLNDEQLKEVFSELGYDGKKVNIVGDQTIIFSLLSHMNKNHWKFPNPSLVSFVRKRFMIDNEDIPETSQKSNALKILIGDRVLPIDKLKLKLQGTLKDGKQKETMLVFSTLFDDLS